MTGIAPVLLDLHDLTNWFGKDKHRRNSKPIGKVKT